MSVRFQSMWGMKAKTCVCSGSVSTGILSQLKPHVWPKQDFSRKDAGRTDHSKPKCTFETKQLCVLCCFIFSNVLILQLINRSHRTVFVIGLTQFVLVWCFWNPQHAMCAHTNVCSPWLDTKVWRRPYTPVCVCTGVRVTPYSQWSIHLWPGTQIGSPVEKDRDWGRLFGPCTVTQC